MFTRYAIFYTPPRGPLAAFGAAWLGWDLARAAMVEHPKLGGLDIAAITDVPRKYGMHGTIKPPFALADDCTQKELQDALKLLCSDMQPVTLAGLELITLGRFMALCPFGETTALNDLAAHVVTQLDRFRAPLTEGDLARRRTANLTPAQSENLRKWGYPFVMDAFRFHITLTGRLDKQSLTETIPVLEGLIPPLLSQPFLIDSLTLVGQRTDGMFEEIGRYPLGEKTDPK